MATATYTLQHDGIARKNDTVIDGEWWSRSPTGIKSVGAGYEAMATILSDTGANLTGIFDEWLPLVLDRAWSAESASSSMTTIRVQVRVIGDKEIVGQSEISLENVSTGGWNPDFQTDNVGAGSTSVVNYTDGNKVATLVSLDPLAGLIVFGGTTERSSGKRYIEFKMLVGDATIPNFSKIQTQLIQAGLMPTTLKVRDVSMTLKILGMKFENDGVIGTQGNYIRVFENQFDLSNGFKTPFGKTGDVIAFAVDFTTLDWTVFYNNTFVAVLEDFGFGDAYGPVQPNIQLPIPFVPWSVRLQESADDFDFTPPVGYIPWADPE